MHPQAISSLQSVSAEARAEALSLRKQAGVCIPFDADVCIAPSVTIGSGAVILAGCILTGDTVIGDGCVIGPNTVLHNVKVGSGTELNNVCGTDAAVGKDCTLSISDRIPCSATGSISAILWRSRIPALTTAQRFHT